MFESYEALKRAHSGKSLRSSSSMYSLGSSPSTFSIDSKSSKWEEHVKMTLRRNERIRLQAEATKLRDAFVMHDPRLTGRVPNYMLRACLKAGHALLPDAEMRNIAARFRTNDGHFAWLRFCESLEKGNDAPAFHPRRSSGTLIRPSTAASLLPRNTTVSAQFMASKASRRSLGGCDADGDGGVSYEEFVDKLARGTVSNAAMGKRGMQSLEAMGVDSQEMLAEQLGHKKLAKFKPTINAGKAKPPSRPTTPTGLVKPGTPTQRPGTPTQLAPPAKKELTHEQKFQQEKELKSLMAMAEEGLNSRFSDMYKAFQYIDLDRSGRLSRDEISRALDLWNIPLSDDKLDLILGDCDADGDGGVSYEEFVDKLARGTVSNAAMGKRGMQSLEAMGVDSQEMLAEQLGHKKLAKFKPTINAGKAKPPSRPTTPTGLVKPGTPTQLAPPAKKELTHEQKFQQEKELKSLMAMAEEGLNSRFSDMYKAFQYIDLDRSGRLSRDEISRALDLWNIPLSDDKLDLILGDCDADGDGGVSYEEFVDKLARGTVSNAAMGKRGMQSLEAMGVDSQEMLAEQLGHKKLAKFKPTINAGKAKPPSRPTTPTGLVKPGTPTQLAPPAKKELTHEQKFQQEKELKSLMAMAEEGLNSRFSDMYKAFQYIDLDRSGRLSRDEISRALDLWNIPLSDDKLDLILGDCDADGDGGVSYEEFVDKLARGTVSNAAMGKRGMQSLEAMGVDSQEMLAEQLGHKKLAKFKPSLNK